MGEINEGFKLGNAAMGLVSKIFSPSFTRRQAIADAEAEVHGALASQLTTYIENLPRDPDILDAIISCGGKMNLINLAKIVQMAASQLNETAAPALITDDWTANFKDKARTCYDEEMSRLWATLLAGEANAPGSYSRKTVNVLADMDIHDAKLFSNLCRFQLMQYGYDHERTIVIIDLETAWIYKEYGITKNSLAQLIGLGLVELMGNTVHLSMVEKRDKLAHSNGWIICGPSPGKGIDMGGTSFTHSGLQMSKLCLPMDTPTPYVELLSGVWGRDNEVTLYPELTIKLKDGTLQADPGLGRIVRLS